MFANNNSPLAKNEYLRARLNTLSYETKIYLIGWRGVVFYSL
jgi:hypothetical protein